MHARSEVPPGQDLLRVKDPDKVVSRNAELLFINLEHHVLII